MSRIAVIRPRFRSAQQMAAYSRSALDRPLGGGASVDAELWVTIAADEALILGAFQRGAGMPDTWPLARRGSGGPEVRVGPGTIHVALALAHPGALTPCDETRIVNRSVRPLLRALTKTARPAHFFGRDWVSIAHRPAAWVGFAHDALTRRTLFEAIVATSTRFAVRDRGAFLEKADATLEQITGKEPNPHRIAEAIVDAYLAAYGALPVESPEEPSVDDDGDLRVDPPWAAMADEAIGVIGAGPDAKGVFRVGGDLLVSRDAIARLEERVARVEDDAVGLAVDETLRGPGVALDGVRSLASVRDVILRARRTLSPKREPL